MKKKEFLQELEKRLHILNDQERRDVLEEYAQHIDLKIANGMSEEEAVAVFGKPEELAAELLDAYRINSACAAENMENQPENIVKRAGHLAGSAGMAAAAAVRRAAGGIWHVITAVLLFIRNTVSGAARRVSGLFRRLSGRQISGEENYEAQAEREERRRRREEEKQKRMQERRLRWEERRREGREKGFSALFGRFMRWLGRVVRFCCVLLVRVAVIGFACPVILAGLFFLFLFGAVLVLLIQGYPVLGIGVGSFGIVLAAFGVTGFLLSLAFGKKKRVTDQAGIAQEGKEERL